jgi:hypothetical protein
MVRTRWNSIPLLGAVIVILSLTGTVKADAIFVSPPAVSYYYPAPTVTYYSPPVVFAPAPTVSYSYGAAVSYYTPSQSYYAVPAAVMTTRYGLFGRPRVISSYYQPVYVGR